MNTKTINSRELDESGIGRHAIRGLCKYLNCQWGDDLPVSDLSDIAMNYIDLDAIDGFGFKSMERLKKFLMDRGYISEP